MAVYLLHFSLPYPNRRWLGVQHYVGFTPGASERSVTTRVGFHLRGQGSRLLAAVVGSGRTVVVARQWLEGDRGLERRLKERHGGVAGVCPICTETALDAVVNVVNLRRAG